MDTDELPLTSERALYSLHKILGEHSLVDGVVTKVSTWGELVRADTATRVFLIGPWAAQLKVPAVADPLPDFGPGVDVASRYSRAYPQRLTDLYDAPVLLYRRGRLPQGPFVAIGGTFHPSQFGIDVARGAARAAVNMKKTVVAALDGGSGEIALRAAVEMGGKVLAVGHGDLSAPSHYSTLVGQILENGGAIMSEWGVGEAWTESRAFAAQRIVAALGSAVVLTELGTHPAGGAHYARASVGTGRYLVVPEPLPEDMINAAYTGLAVFGRARSFSPKLFGSHPRMSARVAAGQPAADYVVKNESDMAAALAQAFNNR